MKIILLKKIKNLEIGTITTVKNGYAKNFLIPSQIAIIANKKNIEKIEKIEKTTLNIEKKSKYLSQKDLKKINEINIIIPAIVQNNDKIYGSINKQRLFNIFKYLDIKINIKNLITPLLIKTTGDYKLEFKNKEYNITTIIYLTLMKINDK